MSIIVIGYIARAAAAAAAAGRRHNAKGNAASAPFRGLERKDKRSIVVVYVYARYYYYAHVCSNTTDRPHHHQGRPAIATCCLVYGLAEQPASPDASVQVVALQVKLQEARHTHGKAASCSPSFAAIQ